VCCVRHFWLAGTTPGGIRAGVVLEQAQNRGVNAIGGFGTPTPACADGPPVLPCSVRIGVAVYLVSCNAAVEPRLARPRAEGKHLIAGPNRVNRMAVAPLLDADWPQRPPRDRSGAPWSEHAAAGASPRLYMHGASICTREAPRLLGLSPGWSIPTPAP